MAASVVISPVVISIGSVVINTGSVENSFCCVSDCAAVSVSSLAISVLDSVLSSCRSVIMTSEVFTMICSGIGRIFKEQAEKRKEISGRIIRILPALNLCPPDHPFYLDSVLPARLYWRKADKPFCPPGSPRRSKHNIRSSGVTPVPVFRFDRHSVRIIVLGIGGRRFPTEHGPGFHRFGLRFGYANLFI